MASRCVDLIRMPPNESPDIIIVRNDGSTVRVEVKATGKQDYYLRRDHYTFTQHDRLDRIARLGGLIIYAIKFMTKDRKEGSWRFFQLPWRYHSLTRSRGMTIEAFEKWLETTPE